MQPLVALRVLGILLMLFSITLLPPVFISMYTHDGAAQSFLSAFFVVLVGGLVIWLPVYKQTQELKLRDGFVVVVLFWIALSAAGSLPFMLAEQPHMSLVDSVFESVSGLTTTGATVITGIDDLPLSIRYYRQQLQWLGGMGIIVLAVAILPMLGIGGMQLYRAETPGPMKEAKLTPRITETAKALWYIYLGLTVMSALAYWLAGMSAFDAISHSFSTVSIGGFSTHDASIGWFDSYLIESIAIVFMLLSGINFALHFVAWRSLDPRVYLRDAEVRAYFTILSVVAIATSVYLLISNTFDDPVKNVMSGIFHAVSIGTTTGFTTAEYAVWPGVLPVLLIFTSFIGGCASSTAGGIKVVRFLLLLKQGRREIMRLLHPSALITIKMNRRPVPDRVIDAVWGFFSAYAAIFVLLVLALMLTGLDQVTAFSAVSASINNLGPGLGDVSANYGNINTAAKWILSLAMLLGRLEIFTLLVLFIPAFWRK